MSHDYQGNFGAHLFNDKVQILSATLDLVTDALEFDLGSLLQSGFDRHLKDLVLSDLLARGVISLGLDLHLLGDAAEEVLQRYGKRFFD